VPFVAGDHAIAGSRAAWAAAAANASVSTAAAVALAATMIRINPSVFIGSFIVDLYC